jgi:hypothetical protein
MGYTFAEDSDLEWARLAGLDDDVRPGHHRTCWRGWASGPVGACAEVAAGAGSVAR